MRLLVSLLAVIPLLLAGCGQRASQQLVAAESSYNEGRYEEAYQQAVAAQQAARDSGGSGKNPEVAQAAYLAGMSAYRLDRLGDAERELDTAIDAGEGETLGRAYAQRGAIFLRQGKYMAAAVDYELAADLLPGEDASRARSQASAARQAAAGGAGSSSPGPIPGLSVSASRTPGGQPSAGGASSGGRGPTTVDLPPLRTSWTLQVACFRDRAAAERQAKALAPTATAQGLGAPKIIAEENPSLGQVYCVVIGEFATREGADRAKERLGRKDYFVRTMRGG